jgi:hypothetical protein
MNSEQKVQECNEYDQGTCRTAKAGTIKNK